MNKYIFSSTLIALISLSAFASDAHSRQKPHIKDYTPSFYVDSLEKAGATQLRADAPVPVPGQVVSPVAQKPQMKLPEHLLGAAVLKEYKAALDAAGTGVAPTACVGGTALNLFGGPASANCSACTTEALAGSCTPPTLICFENNTTCGAGMDIVTPTSECAFYGTYGSCRLQGQVSPASCDAPLGGEPSTAGLPNYAAFCESCEECTAQAAECAIYAAAGTAATCGTLEGYPVAYTLFESTQGDAACESCAIAMESCNGTEQPYLVGVISCDAPVSTACTSPIGGTPLARSNVSSNCATNHPEPYPGSFTPTGTARTVCCKEPLPPEFDVQKLNPG